MLMPASAVSTVRRPVTITRVVSGDSARARKAMRLHLDNSLQRYRRLAERDPPEDRHAVTLGMRETKAVLRVNLPLVSGLAIPPCRFDKIPGKALTARIHGCQQVLRHGIALFRQRPEFRQGRRMIATFISRPPFGKTGPHGT